MKKAIVKRLLCLVLCVMMSASILAACGGGARTEGENSATTKQPETSTQPAQEALLEYSVYHAMMDSPPKWVDNPNDVVTPYLEQKFNIKVNKVMTNQGINFQERFNMLLASNDLPDVITSTITDSYVLAAKSGKYAETLDLVDKYMPNLKEYTNESDLKVAQVNGKVYGLPALYIDTMQEKYATDLFALPAGSFCLKIREDILKQCGYSFKSMAELEKQTYDTQKKPLPADFELTPAIKTPDDLYVLLKKIKDLNLKVGGQDVIPFDMPAWAQHHLGSMFGVNTYWNYEPKTGEVSHSLGSPYAKDFYKFMNKLYKEDLINKNFLIDKTVQMQENFASGRVAVSLWTSDTIAAEKALKSVNPEWIIRPVQLPRFESITYAGVDHFATWSAFVLINNSFKDIPRLAKYFDWFYSDEGLDTITWGPESAGLWEIKDGKKVFKDPEMWTAYKTGTPESKVPSNFGLGLRDAMANKPSSRAAGFAAGFHFNSYNPMTFEKSYPFEMANPIIYFGQILGGENLDTKGYIVPAVDETSNAPGTYMWNEFYSKKAANLIAARNDNEFEKEWDLIQKEFMGKTKYEEGKKIMADYFRNVWGYGK